MKYLYVCNTSSDSISKVDIDKFIEVEKISLKQNNFQRVGPHGVCVCKDCILTANNYSNDISIINKNKIQTHKIGMRCNDISIDKNLAYVICGDSNILTKFNLENKNIQSEIFCGELPHSINMNQNKNIIVVANMNDDSISFIDCIANKIIKTVRVGAYPTKVMFSLDNNYVFVCESNMGLNSKGSLSIISLKNFKILNRVQLGNSPIDMYCDEKYCYVSNFGDGTISIIDIVNIKKVKDIKVGGMPRGIIKFKENLYIGDNYNNLLIRVNINTESKKVISIGGEPTGMTLG